MGFWNWIRNGAPDFDGITPNGNGELDYIPGDPNGFEIEPGNPIAHRSAPFPQSTPWSGWPSEWNTPNWGGQTGLNKLVDTAWNCLDLNSNILSSMPAYRMASGQVAPPPSWMANPDPTIYSSWQEFAKQLFWDFMMGEAFVLPMANGADGYPLRLRVVPPWLVNVEMRGGTREYKLGSTDVTDDILHIRYQSNTADARGHGPLEVAGARMTAVGMLQRYANKISETGGTPMYWMEVDRRLNQPEAEDLLDRWVESRIRRAGEPALVSGGAKLNQATSMSAREMTLLELQQFNSGQIAIALGVPPFLMGLPSGDSMTYSNSESLFDFHDRSSLRPKATAVMQALSWKFLPRGQAIELNRDEYTRPQMKELAESFKILIEAGVMTKQEARTMLRLHGPAPETPPTLDTPAPAALSLTGGDNA